MVKKSFILASTSPRRRRMLREAGFNFEVLPPAGDDDASCGPDLAPPDLSLALARAKAASVALARPADLILAADTLVVVEQIIVGKPGFPGEASATLELLAGRSHQVITGFCLTRGGQVLHQEAVRTKVEFRALSPSEIEAYAATGSPLDKAGAYGIQDLGGGLVKAVEGSYTNVVGLPLAEVIEALALWGVEPDWSWRGRFGR